MTSLVAGASGFIGSALVAALASDGGEVRSLVRNPDKAGPLRDAGSEIVVADLAREGDLAAALDGVDVAYFLVHMMEGGAGYEEAETAAARRFGSASTQAGVGRVVYLGGLGNPETSPHLRSRHATAAALAETGPPLSYVRAGMVIGAASESFRLLRSIAERLPAVPDKSWLHHRTQPIGLRDAIRYLRQAPLVEAAAGREIEIGGPDVLSHLELVDLMARELGRRPRRRLSIPVATPGMVAAGAAIVTDGDAAVAAQLTLSLVADTIVEDPSGAALFDIRPESTSVALQRAIEADERAAEAVA
ncbi:MAG: hypothetical protein QOJ01_898 [Solirubrobacterales bacterium]|nr:hypothetical protein [Solirubrobacterales bacterium]